MDASMGNKARKAAYITTFVILLIGITHVYTKSSFAGCQCVASSSANVEVATTEGVWKSYDDGGPPCNTAGPYKEGAICNLYKQGYINTPFCIPTVAELLANIVRILFIIAGMIAILMLLLGGFEWLSSGGDEKKIQGARARMLAAVIGLVVMVAVMTLIVLIEQVVFGGKVCMGISCPLNMQQFVITGDGSSYTGRPPCFGSYGTVGQSSTSSAKITGTASRSARLTITSIPAHTATPIIRKRFIIVTATPGSLNNLPTPTNNPGSRIIVVPYGSVPTNTPTQSVLPGTGGGGGGPRPTIPPL